jgi:hypothetical protein
MSLTPTPQRLGHGQSFDLGGYPLYLLGIDFVRFFHLESLQPWIVRARFGRQGYAFPSPDMPVFTASKWQVRIKPQAPQGIEAQILEKLLLRREALLLPASEQDLMPVVDREDCCHSPCFGCLCHAF